VLAKHYRGKGKGKQLIQTMLTDIIKADPQAIIKLSSQTDACEFYQKLGFELQGEPYDDGGIEHITMQFVKTDGAA
jgi:ElaA protein